MNTFQQKLDKIIKKNNSLVCVGLDSDIKKISKKNQFLFNKWVIEATHDLVCSYKLNTAFYESIGHIGIKALKDTCDYLVSKHPEIPIIIDAKRGDIGNTNEGYVQFVFTYLNADGVTVHPYLGEEAIRPFLLQKDKGIIILCRTSNKGAGEFQDLVIGHLEPRPWRDRLRERSRPKAVNHASLDFSSAELGRNDLKLYQYIADQVAHKWNINKNCLLVVGATYPKELKEIREIVGQEMTFLVPGIGAQGGDIAATLQAGLNNKGSGLIINSSRGIIFAPNPRIATLKLREDINAYR